MSPDLVPAEWTPDCQGKWDYDGNLVQLSTRYWPRGGGLTIRYPDGRWETNGNQDIRPSAYATIYLGEDTTLAEQRFEGDTEAQVKAAVEQWATEQFARVAAILRREFGV